MKKLKQTMEYLKSLEKISVAENIHDIWSYICYSPKMPVRHHQEQLIELASKNKLTVKDEFFSGHLLSFPVFRWGAGKDIVLLTHGWGSKAADFSMLIEQLLENPDLTIIAFDAPGNGEAEGELSNLILYMEAVQAIITAYGMPVITIGHSLGAMANVAALANIKHKPNWIISLTPLVNLKANFAASMDYVGIPIHVQEHFFQNFEENFNMKIAYFHLNSLYTFDNTQQHLVLYDKEDKIAPYDYLHSYLDDHPQIEAINLNAVGHEKILRSPEAIALILGKVNSLQSEK
ncbi:alpha/beta fold hydrolase [Sphingobacterium faecium]|jgi:predicted alpha/beta hydrolase family esterase|uniref:alpha/beta fold hydrolase n=1 Tax=Sphingobacterium faecium TaxID=34087 RepID=UPI0004E5F756|nr:alpha/beta hydrolase [Sphingobacterium faecium]UXD68043.1 alpha/beta hydrolase [Sphingobacterium faecium]WGQ15750.1 alpha/beta hydrolase [Sphingobacterium faecium]CDT17160.1 Alpha/beta hydrolase fold protein [Sphingobacterium sp. PM2-P1-29]SJN48526.1 Probable hydrolase [Sphingobacterium faecium PCAi_F2.5]